MRFMDLEEAAGFYTDEPMRGNIERLREFQSFHCLLPAAMSARLKLNSSYPGMPAELADWLRFCNGGLLFGTSLLSTVAHDKSLDLDFDTYEELNAEETRHDFGLPEGYVIFAVMNYGNPVCFHPTGEDPQIYEWELDTGTFSDVWASFTDWLTEIVDIGVRLIAEEAIEPLGIKLGLTDGGENDE